MKIEDFMKELSGLNEVSRLPSDKLFFSSSKFKPKGWFADHVGFILEDGRLIQMSGHMQSKGVFILKKLSEMPGQENDDYIEYKLPKVVQVPTNNIYGSENCSTFIADVLKEHDISITIQKINNFLKRGLKD